MAAQTLITLERLREILDYDRSVGIFRWRSLSHTQSKRIKIGCIAGYKTKRGYVSIGIDCIHYLAHRLAWFYVYGIWPGQIDHIDGNHSNNAISNLRLATPAQNQQNKGKLINNTSGYKGVVFRKDIGRWQAYIRAKPNRHFLGFFDTKEDAAMAYAEAALKFHQEFAHL